MANESVPLPSFTALSAFTALLAPARRLGLVAATSLSLATFSLGACMTNAPVPESSASSDTMVSRIDMSESVGQVGKSFESKINLRTNRLGDSEVVVRSLPPGLRFDEENMTIKGVPEADGFYAVIVKVRERQGKGIHFLTPESAWYSERLQLDIYKPVEGQADARDYNDSTGSDDIALGEL